MGRWPLRASVAAASVAVGGVALCDPDIRAGMFDPEALERGAKALREINASPHAKRVSIPQICVMQDQCSGDCGRAKVLYPMPI